MSDNVYQSKDIVSGYKKPTQYYNDQLRVLAANFKFFSLAPIYTYLRVPFDITAQFKAEVVDCEHIHMFTAKPAVLNVEHQYEYFLEGIPKEHASEFIAYVKNMTIINRKTNLYAEIYSIEVPMSMLVPELAETQQFTTYTVFVAFANTFSIRLMDTLSGFKEVVSFQANQEVIERADKILRSVS
jgi:hypothetical protein